MYWARQIHMGCMNLVDGHKAGLPCTVVHIFHCTTLESTNYIGHMYSCMYWSWLNSSFFSF